MPALTQSHHQQQQPQLPNQTTIVTADPQPECPLATQPPDQEPISVSASPTLNLQK
jgi:hypothetical protein